MKEMSGLRGMEYLEGCLIWLIG